ncbi:MAG: glutaminase [Pseudomonadaceae bacterium]|nr:glutaminase [Pseudomonadaceae bacterium]
MKDYQSLLEEIYAQLKSSVGLGQVADYIPALAAVSPDKFAIAIETVDGQQFQVGDAQERFSIQSISKVFNLTLGMKLSGDTLWQRVGVEPSGNPFNSLIQLELNKGIPRNPFINAGALVIIDSLLDSLEQPNKEMLNFVRKLRCQDVFYDDLVAASERETAFTNLALANYMKGQNNLRHAVQDVLEVYCYQCAINMSCAGLARSFLYLANGGVVPASGEVMVASNQAKRINALMMTSGFYDEAGEFAYRVGLPGKSGVGGGIVAVVPGELSIAVWSPELNDHGNSVRGIMALEEFTSLTGRSVF